MSSAPRDRGNRFERSNSFKRSSMRRGGTSRRGTALPHRKPVVTNRGIYYVTEVDSVPADGSSVLSTTATGTSTVDSGSSFSDWIQVTDDENSTLGQKAGCPTGVLSSATGSAPSAVSAGGKRRRKKTSSRNFSLEGKSVPFDSPLPSGNRVPVSTHEPSPVDSSVNGSVSDATSFCVVPTGANSTYGSSCTSGVHSMEKTCVVSAGGRPRRGAPSLLAVKPRLRHSGRRGTGRRIKKTTRHQADVSGHEDMYRVFSQLPLLFDTRSTTAASGTSGSAVCSPMSFNRQNPITRWLEESERLQRSNNSTGDSRARCVPPEMSCPLWSELVNYVSPYMAETAASNTESFPAPSSKITDSVLTSAVSESAPAVSVESSCPILSSEVVDNVGAGSDETCAVPIASRTRRASVCQRLTDGWKRLSVAASGSGFSSVDRSIASPVDITV